MDGRRISYISRQRASRSASGPKPDCPSLAAVSAQRAIHWRTSPTCDVQT